MYSELFLVGKSVNCVTLYVNVALSLWFMQHVSWLLISDCHLWLYGESHLFVLNISWFIVLSKCLALMQIDVLVFIQWASCLQPYYILHSVSPRPLAAAVHCNDLFYNDNEMIFRRETVLYRKASNECRVLNECWVSSKCRNLEATQSCQSTSRTVVTS